MVTGECPGGDLGDSELPKWAEKQSPSSSNWSYYVGYATDANSIEEARNIAYKNALLEAAKREFPELIKISEYSTESLKNSAYQKNFDATEFAQISFAEIEHGANDSPYVSKSQKTNCKINAYVRLRWSPTKIALEKTRLKKLNQELTAGANESNANVGDTDSGSGTLEIKTVPAKAQIIIDGEPFGPSNLILKKISIGKHQIMLQKPGYKFEERDIIIEKDKTQTALFQLVRIESAITITTKPAGASVFLNGKPYGVSDNTTGILKIEKLSPGEYIPRIEKFDYETVNGLSIILGETPAEAALSTEFSKGSATFLTNVPEVDVFCDSKHRGKTSKTAPFILKVSDLKGGNNDCRFSKDGYSDKSVAIDIKKSRKRTDSIGLEPTKIPEKQNAPIEASRPQKNGDWSNSKNQNTTSANNIQKDSQFRAYVLFACSFGTGLAGFYYSEEAESAFANYKKAKTKSDAEKYRSQSESFDTKKYMSLSASAVSLIFGLIFYNKDSTPKYSNLDDNKINLNVQLNENRPTLQFVANW